MLLRRTRRASLIALLSSAAAALLGGALVLQPAAYASVQPAAGPDLFREAEVPNSGTVLFRATGDSTRAGTNSFTSPPSTIWCGFGVFDPHVADLTPFEIQGTARAACTWPVPTMVVEVSLFRNGSEVSSNVSTGLVKQVFDAHTFGPCVGGAYFAAGTATIFPPPGYTPSFRVFTDVSNVVPINGAGTAVPPFVCQQSSTPPPTPTPPPPSGAPVINSLHCEYLGNNQFDCHLSASTWTQIRWTYNGTRQAAWDNQTTVHSGCGGGIPRIAVSVSSSNGTTTAQDSFRCEGQPL